jgi:uncharacterized protein YbbC (DUF1343 family)
MRRLKPCSFSRAKRSLVLVMTGCTLAAWPAAGRSETPQQNRVKFGNELFVESLPRELSGKRLGLVVNHTAVLPDGTPLHKALLNKGIRVSAIFSPEHGFSGRIRNGQDVSDSSDTNDVKIFSLYGNGSPRKPTREQMAHIDAFVYDIQDVGTRFYTYITTLKQVLEAAAPAGIPVYVLDRPNPLGGEWVEGPILIPEYRSSIGALPIPIRYGLTCGELAAMMKGEGWVPAQVDLIIVPMEGWKRYYFWQEMGYPWIPTSPNIPSADSAVAYPGTCLLGGIILNQGLGTQEPFLIFGAPWMDTAKVIGRLPPQCLAGITLESLTFTPQALAGKTLDPPYKDRLCKGARIRMNERGRFRSVLFALELIRVITELYPERIFKNSQSLSLMFGTGGLAGYLRGELSFSELMEQVKQGEELFRKQRQPYLLY